MTFPLVPSFGLSRLPPQPMRTSTPYSCLLMLGLLGCHSGVGDAGPAKCAEDRCESAGSRDELIAALDGFGDPVAGYLRTAATERGTLSGTYRDVVDAVGTTLGCDATTERSYVVLSNDDFLPKPILTRCSGDATAASQFFVAFAGSHAGMDPRSIHLAAWDEAAGVYRRYSTLPTDTGTGAQEMAINVSPDFCLGCHGGPEKLQTWVPAMNEMTSPWSGWNAAPGFASQLFDEHLDPVFATDPTYQEVTRPGLLDSAASFEPIVRHGIARVTGARLKQRSAAPDARLALALLRPVFCDESVNYVSEVHQSGELRSSALVDDALRSLYRSLGVDAGWSWIPDTRIQLAMPGPDEPPVTLIAVRGEATVQAELGLVARGTLEPLQALRVRALDWKHPVQSELRCGLFREAMERITAGVLDDAVAASGAATTGDLVPLVFDEIMIVAIDGVRVPLRAAMAGELLAIPDASDPAALTALRTGAWDELEASVLELGTAIEAHVASYQVGPSGTTARAVLAAERDRRACLAVAQNPTAPIFTDVLCP